MRLIAVPLARLRPSAHPVCTFLAQRTPPTTTPTTPSSSSSSPSTSSKGKPPPLATRLLNKASDFWLGLGRDGQDGKPIAVLDWKRRTYNMGEKLMDRIEYEEWALKAVDPALGPSLRQGQEVQKPQLNDAPSHLATVPIHFPPNLVSPSHLLQTLRTLTASRTPHHRRSLILCVVGMPFTIPFMLIPIVPNLPFFYLAWRAWSHWRAFQSSQYLSSLLSQNRLLPKADSSLNPIFEASRFESIRGVNSTSASHNVTPSASPKVTEAVLLLSSDQIEMLKKNLELDQQCVNELGRARQQTLLSVRKGETDKLEKAAEGQMAEEGNADARQTTPGGGETAGKGQAKEKSQAAESGR